MTYDPPITITKGGTYRGRWRSTTLGQTVITIATTEDVVIEDSIIVGRGHLIAGVGVGIVTIRNTQGFGLTRFNLGETPGKFAGLGGARGVIIENNYIEHAWGIDIGSFKGSGIGAETVRVRNNQFRNAESYPTTNSHSVQLNGVRAANIEIAWNEIVNEPFSSRTEDVISIYNSGGTQASPLQVHNNYIQGAYAPNPVTDGHNGSGIMLEAGSSWIEVHNNQVVSTTNTGIGIYAGHDLKVFDNRVISSGYLPDGRWIQGQNIGLYVWDGRKTGPTAFYNNYSANNTVAWSKKDGSGKIFLNNWWFPDCAPGMCIGNTNFNPAVATLAMEAAEYELWTSIVTQACVKIGVQ